MFAVSSCLAAAVNAQVPIRVDHALRRVVGGRALRVGAIWAAPRARQVARLLGRLQEVTVRASLGVVHL